MSTPESNNTHSDDAGDVDSGLYRQDGDLFHPSSLTEGPWRPDAQHGGPPSALLAVLCERQSESGEMLARIHVNLLSSIPLEPLRGLSYRTPISRRIAHVAAELYHQDRKVAEATALAIRGSETPDPDWARNRASNGSSNERLAASWDQVAPTVAPLWATTPTARPFHRDGMEHRFLEGRFDEAGPAVDWVRLTVPVVEGVALTGFQRAMAVADVGSGISAVFTPSKGFGMINADLNVAFVAEPNGEWLRLEAATAIGDLGTGVCHTNIYDQHQLVAVATQALLGASFDPGVSGS